MLAPPRLKILIHGSSCHQSRESEVAGEKRELKDIENESRRFRNYWEADKEHRGSARVLVRTKVESSVRTQQDGAKLTPCKDVPTSVLFNPAKRVRVSRALKPSHF